MRRRADRKAESMLDILIIMNNYFHDVATAILLASAVIMWALGKRAEVTGPEAYAVLADIYRTLTKFARIALAWIIIGGIPRTIFFTTYEWDPAVVKGIVPALIVKHMLMATAVIVGALLWRSVKRSILRNAEDAN